MRTLALWLAASLAATTLAREAAAAPPWVDRSLTLPAGDFAFDVGTGFVLPPPTGAGVNLEMGIGLTSRIELGVRTALRFGDAGERGAQPDVLCPALRSADLRRGRRRRGQPGGPAARGSRAR